MFLVEIVWATDTARQLVDTVLLPLKLISFAEIVLAGGTALAMLAGAGLGIKAFYSGKKHQVLGIIGLILNLGTLVFLEYILRSSGECSVLDIICF